MLKHRMWNGLIPWLAVFMLVACGAPAADVPTPEDPAASPAAAESPAAEPQALTCEQAFAAAAETANIQDAPDALDPALQACDSIDEWMRAAAAYPNTFGEGSDPQTFLINRCLESDTAVGGLCAEVKEQFPEQFP